MIGVFDSGVGGLTVLKAIRERMPHADIVYFGDTENAPYGPRSATTIAELLSMALRQLAHAGATDIVSACNSASVSVHTVPIDLLRVGTFNVVEMVGPTVKALRQRGMPVALLGTQATVRSGMYQRACHDAGVTVTAIAVPDLAGLIEQGAPTSALVPVVKDAVRSALHGNPGVISLSCTHYPLVRDVFAEVLQREGRSDIELFDPASAVAETVALRFYSDGRGSLRFLLSKDSDIFRQHVARMFPDTAYEIEMAPSVYQALSGTRGL